MNYRLWITMFTHCWAHSVCTGRTSGYSAASLASRENALVATVCHSGNCSGRAPTRRIMTASTFVTYVWQQQIVQRPKISRRIIYKFTVVITDLLLQQKHPLNQIVWDFDWGIPLLTFTGSQSASPPPSASVSGSAADATVVLYSSSNGEGLLCQTIIQWGKQVRS